jgi:hypothetical protein
MEMAKSDKPRGSREHGDYHGEHGRHGALGRDYPVFAKFRGARWQGSAPPTAQAFARALAQWRRLPGAIGATAADLGKAAATAPPASEPEAADDVP